VLRTSVPGACPFFHARQQLGPGRPRAAAPSRLGPGTPASAAAPPRRQGCAGCPAAARQAARSLTPDSGSSRENARWALPRPVSVVLRRHGDEVLPLLEEVSHILRCAERSWMQTVSEVSGERQMQYALEWDCHVGLIVRSTGKFQCFSHGSRFQIMPDSHPHLVLRCCARLPDLASRCYRSR
jgi:hypothetical protein